MNIRYTKPWAEPNTKHYEILFRKIKDSVDELEDIFIQRNEMINYIEELHNLLQPQEHSTKEGPVDLSIINDTTPQEIEEFYIKNPEHREPSPNEGFGKYDPLKKDKRIEKRWSAIVMHKNGIYISQGILHFRACDFNEALTKVLNTHHIESIVSLELSQND